jgi:hypothetical protein
MLAMTHLGDQRPVAVAIQVCCTCSKCMRWGLQGLLAYWFLQVAPVALKGSAHPICMSPPRLSPSWAALATPTW